MPCIEILQLQVRPTVNPADPTILQNMIAVRTALRERVHNTNSRFYQGITDPSLVYIFGSWPKLADHEAFTTSPLKAPILALQGDQTKFNWMIHINLETGIEELPFEAPIMAISTWKTEGQAGEKGMLGSSMEAASGWRGVDEWRIDGEANGRERVLVSGWERVEAYHAFVKRTVDGDERARKVYEGMGVVFVENMES